MKKILYTSLLICFISSFAKAQKYLVLFKDKTNSTYSISKPKDFLSDRAIARRARQNIKISERDFPPNQTYINQVIAAGGKVWYKSRWVNGVVIEANQANLNNILKLSFVKGIDGNIQLKNQRQSGDNQAVNVFKKNKFNETFDDITLGNSANQLQMLGVDKMYAAGFHGEGMYVAVLDNGFQNADTLSFFKHLFTEKRIIETYDFVGNKKNVYDAGGHGTHCLSCLAAFKDGKIVGTAYKASYILLHTEDDNSETRLEEANWLVAAEFADSVGVDVISTSLGYSEFDDNAQNYTYKDMNGRKTLITRAAETAANVGMLVVVAAGNEGSGTWKYITAPADADSVIAVGAVNSIKNYASFSSIGPSADGRIKPELAAQGVSTTIGLPTGVVTTGNGTSYATPLLAGLATSLWQAFPSMTNVQLRNYLIKSGNLYQTPNNLLGYGIPTFQAAYDVIKKEYIVLADEEISKENFAKIYPNPVKDFNEIHLILNDSSPKSHYDLSLFDTSGKQIWAGTTTEKELNLPFSSKNAASGEYFLKIISAEKVVTLRIVKI